MNVEANATNLRVIRDMRFEIRRLDDKIAQLQRRKVVCQSIIDKAKRKMQTNDDERKRQIEEAWREYNSRTTQDGRDFSNA